MYIGIIEHTSHFYNSKNLVLGSKNFDFWKGLDSFANLTVYILCGKFCKIRVPIYIRLLDWLSFEALFIPFYFGWSKILIFYAQIEKSFLQKHFWSCIVSVLKVRVWRVWSVSRVSRVWIPHLVTMQQIPSKTLLIIYHECLKGEGLESLNRSRVSSGCNPHLMTNQQIPS